MPVTCKTCRNRGAAHPEFDAVCKDAGHEPDDEWIGYEERDTQ